MSKTVSYKGKLANGEEDRLKLSTINGKTGYKITKFQVISSSPAGSSPEAVIKIYKESKVPDFVIDFTDSDLLAAAFYEGNNGNTILTHEVIVFDNEMFNQDIFVNCSTTEGNLNYYIELERMSLTDIEATMLTLKSIRSITS